MCSRKDDPFVDLRKRAEQILDGRRVKEANPDLAKLIHELEIYQVELELQNEELKRAQGELEASRNEYYSLFNSAPVGFVTIGPKGLISRVNRTFEEMFSRSLNALIGLAFSSLIHPEDTHHYSYLLKNLALHHKGAAELRMKGGKGIICVRIEAVAYLDEGGAFSSWHFAISDITRQKESEAALKRAHDELELRVRDRTEELELKNKELQDFAFIASHDLAEPLRKIQTFGKMVADRSVHEGKDVDKVSSDYLNRMQKAAGRMKVLLDSLLLYSRVSTETKPMVETDLKKSVGEAVSDLETVTREKSASVEVGDLPAVYVDPVQMSRVFQNLIGNALKYHRKGQAPRVKVYARPGAEKNSHEICIEDNGIGFDEKFLGKIFLPFQRLHGRSSEYDGVGMGLAICQKIIERHGGKVTAKSELGKGSTFIVTLPGERMKR